MTDLLVWRSCDISGTGAREAILRNADVTDRAIALIENEDGLPPDSANVSIPGAVPPPSVDIISVSWCSVRNTGRGTLPPGVYNYKAIPIDTCTGVTGAPIDLPSLVINELGEEGSLCVTVGARPDPCISLIIQRDGVIIGAPVPVASQLVDEYPLITTPDPNGTFINGTANSFDIDSGADLIVGDSVRYQNTVVRVIGRSGDTVKIDPPIGLAPNPPGDGFTDIGARTFLYTPPLPAGDPFALPFPILPSMPFPFSFTALDIPVPGFGKLQLGDIIVLGGKTAIITSASITPLIKQVLCVPLGIIPPPLPAGIGWIVYRTLPTVDPSTVFDAINNGIGLYSDGDENGFRIAGNPALDSKFVPGAIVAYAGQQVQVDSVDPDGSNTRVTLATPLSAAPTGTEGVYFVLPEELSQFLGLSTIDPSGAYQRLSRLTETTMVSGLLQMTETGSETARAGSLNGKGTNARNLLDRMLTQSGYQGLNGLLRRVRGVDTTSIDRYFNMFNGDLILSGNRLWAVNNLANQGNGQIIDLAALRLLQNKVCGSFEMLNNVRIDLDARTVSAVRLEEVKVLDPVADCPPDQLPQVTYSTEVRCRGVATAANKVREGETIRVFLSTPLQSTSARSLVARGLTKDEATNAILGLPSGRVVEVITVPSRTISAITTFAAAFPAPDEILSAGRVVRINLGTLTREQIGAVLRRRGRAGIVKRMPGTDPEKAKEGGAQPVDDLIFPALNLLQAVLQYQGSFDVCDFDGALAAIEDPAARAAIAAVFALVDNAFLLLEKGGTALLRVLQNEDFRGALDAIGGVLTAIATDPTLGCLLGPIQLPEFGLPTIPQLDLALQGAASPLQVRFQLTQLFTSALNTLICVLIGQLLKLLPADNAAFAQRAIGCLPSLDLLGLLNIDINIEVTVECSFQRFLTIQDIINEVIAELNEFIQFLNSFGQGFVFRNVAAINTSCAGDNNITDIFDAAANQFGIGNLIGQVKLLTATITGGA